MNIHNAFSRAMATLNRKGLPLLVAILASATVQGAVFIDTSTQKESGFEDGTAAPFTICTTRHPDYGEPSTLNGVKCMKFFWSETGYDGTRMRRGAEACSNLQMFKEGWYGLSFYLPSHEYPEDKDVAIAQIFQAGRCNSWAALLVVRNKQLTLSHRHSCGKPTDVVIADNIKWDAWNPVIIHFVASHENAGTMEVWYGDATKKQDLPSYRAAGINFGFGEWAGDILAAGNQLTFKFGMYCFDAGHYTKDETRTVFFDNVSQLAADKPTGNGWEIVNPTKPGHDRDKH